MRILFHSKMQWSPTKIFSVIPMELFRQDDWGPGGSSDDGRRSTTGRLYFLGWAIRGKWTRMCSGRISGPARLARRRASVSCSVKSWATRGFSHKLFMGGARKRTCQMRRSSTFRWFTMPGSNWRRRHSNTDQRTRAVRTSFSLITHRLSRETILSTVSASTSSNSCRKGKRRRTKLLIHTFFEYVFMNMLGYIMSDGGGGSCDLMQKQRSSARHLIFLLNENGPFGRKQNTFLSESDTDVCLLDVTIFSSFLLMTLTISPC